MFNYGVDVLGGCMAVCEELVVPFVWISEEVEECVVVRHWWSGYKGRGVTCVVGRVERAW